MDKNKCPKCGAERQQDTQECQSCGVIYQRYQESLKKNFNKAITNISEKGLATAKNELEAVSEKFPNIEMVCSNYISFIEMAIREHNKGNHEVASKMFSKLTDKKPELQKAVSIFLRGEDEQKENIITEQPEEDQEQPPVIKNEEEKKTIFHRKGLMRFIAATGIVIFFYIVGTSEKNKSYTPKTSKPSYSSSISKPSASYPTSSYSSSGVADKVVSILNTSYGNICHAELTGIFSKTLKVDWTKNTVKLHAIKVLAEIGSVKEGLYQDGVRYLQFPNDAGTYNVIDWKTGEKTSTPEKTKYYFSE